MVQACIDCPHSGWSIALSIIASWLFAPSRRFRLAALSVTSSRHQRCQVIDRPACHSADHTPIGLAIKLACGRTPRSLV